MDTIRTRTHLAVVVGTAGLLLAACGGGGDTEAATPSTDTTPATETVTIDPTSAPTSAPASEPTETMSEPTEEMSEPPEEMSSDPMAAATPTGSDCSMLPDDVESLAEEPVQTAAAEIPELSTLVAALGMAGMDTTLDTEGGVTLFAPIDTGFDQVPTETLQGAMADPDLITSVLEMHVAEGRLDAAALAEAGTVTTLAGSDVEFDPEAMTVSTPDGSSATVVCADVETVNATVHLIDGVLLPAG